MMERATVPQSRQLQMPSPQEPLIPPTGRVVSNPQHPMVPPRAQGKPSKSMEVPAQGLCPACNTMVYFAERAVAIGNCWHPFCLKCFSCSKVINQADVTEGNGHPFCEACYRRTFLPHSLM